MKITRKIIVCTLVFAMLLLSLTCLSGCYNIKSGKMKNVEGTYELVAYSTNKDEIVENGVKLYVVIRSDGTGYYAYSDNDTALYFSELRCRFTQDPEKSGYYEYVELNFTGNNDSWHTLGINSRLRVKNLNSYKPKYKGNLFEGNVAVDYYINVDFERVSKKTDLSYLEKLFGAHEVIPYGTVNK